MVPLSQVKSTFPVLKNPANRHRAVGFTTEDCTTPSPTPSPRRNPTRSTSATRSPRPGNRVWESGLIANFEPGHQDTWVDYDNPDRAPLLFVAGTEDHIMPPKVHWSNAKHYESPRPDGVPRVRGPGPLDLRSAWLGGRGRPRPRLGPGARRAPTAPGWTDRGPREGAPTRA